jgi:hypothetical protein
MRLTLRGGLPGAGARDRWVTIQTRPDDQVSASGFPVDATWADLATVAMTRVDLEADELERGNQQLAAGTIRWEMPYMVEMDPETVDVTKLRRLFYLGRCFDIIGAVPIGRAEGVALLTEAYGKTPTEAAP